MGQVASAITSMLDNSKEKEAQAKEQLELMMKLADARLDTFEAEIKNMFLDHGSAMKTSVPGKRALRFERSVRVDTHSGQDEGIGKAVDSFFGASETGTAGVLDGFKSVVKTGLSAILGDTSTGESYDKKFFVCIKHNAIIRVDMYTYKYNFSNAGVISNHKNVLAYILCISVVDHKDVTVDELIYLASEFAGDGPVGAGSGFEAYLNGLMKTWGALNAIDPLGQPLRLLDLRKPSDIDIVVVNTGTDFDVDYCIVNTRLEASTSTIPDDLRRPTGKHDKMVKRLIDRFEAQQCSP